MRELFSDSERRALSSVLAVVLLLASVPLCSGIVIVAGPAQPEFTINICHPIQSFDRVTNILLARPAPTRPLFALAELRSSVGDLTSFVSRLAEAPDPPPPKPLV
jgi:hypothetical protein